MAYHTLVYLAKSLTDLGHNVIIDDATGNLRKWRDLAKGIPLGTSRSIRNVA
jgi:predicted kinase